MNKREFDSIIGIFPDRNTIKCKDCKFRQKVMFSGKDIGAGKAYCEIYNEKTSAEGKPNKILFENADCEFYEKENF